MAVKNNDIAEIFDKTADLLEIKGENQYRIRAYHNAAQTVRNSSQNIADLIEKNEDLTKLSGIGKDLAGKIKSIVKTGELELLKELENEFPPELDNLMKISGMGAKKVKALYDRLDIKTIDDLKQAAEEHKIRNIEGFGAKTEENILEGIKRVKKEGKRVKLAIADQYAIPLVEYLKKDKNIEDIDIAGSYRRRQETIGDIDILITCKKPAEIMDRFTEYEDAQKIVSKGETKSTIILKSGIQVDLRVMEKKSYGAALLYFTGSKAHNIVLRDMAVKQGWKINEYGVFEDDKFIAGKTEQEIYKKLGLEYIEPELRENRGEIKAAKEGNLPKLIELDDIKGDLHAHTKTTDGRNTLEEMVEAAQKRGYEYIANTEHTKHVSVTGGLDAKGIQEQIRKIDKLNENLKNFVILKGAEVDILEDGSLDLPDKILKELDIVVCAVHSKFNLSREKQTGRILKAMDNEYFDILAHPTGRMINKREPYDVDMERIMKAAKERGIVLELNSHPARLDLNDIYCKMAKDMGIKIVISTDSHSVDGYDNIRYGIDQARRGWLEADDVINTRILKDLKKHLKSY